MGHSTAEEQASRYTDYFDPQSLAQRQADRSSKAQNLHAAAAAAMATDSPDGSDTRSGHPKESPDGSNTRSGQPKESPDGSSPRSGQPKESADGSSPRSGHRNESPDIWWHQINGARFPRQVLKDPHESARLLERFRRWIVYVFVDGGSGNKLRPRKPRPSGGIGEASSAWTEAGETAAAGGKGPASGGGGPSMAELWATTKGKNFNYKRYMTRTHFNWLKKEMQRAADVLKKSSTLHAKMSKETQFEHEKLKKLIEECATVLKAGIENERTCMRISAEAAEEMKLLVDEMKMALRAGNSRKSFNMTRARDYLKGSKSCLELGRDLTFCAAIVTSALYCLGYLALEDPAPFNPRETKAGKLLFNDFTFGLSVSSCYAVNSPISLMSVLSGNDFYCKAIFRHIEEAWSCKIDLSPSQDIVLNGSMDGLLAKDLKLKCNLPLFNGVNRNVEFCQKHRFGTIGGSLGLNANPLLNLSSMFGNKHCSFGSLIDYDTVPGVVKRLAVGGVLNLMGISCSALCEKLFQPQGALMEPPQPPVSHAVTSTFHLQASAATSVGAEVIHRVEGHSTTVTVGVEHLIDSSTRIKGKLTNNWIFTGLLQQSVGESSSVSLCAQVDIRAPRANPRFGIAVNIGR